MKNYKNLKVGDYVKCIDPNSESSYFTISKLYKIEEIISFYPEQPYETMSVYVHDDKNFPSVIRLYEKKYVMKKYISYKEFFQNLWKIIVGNYYPMILNEENYYYIPAEDYEVDAEKYNI